MKLVYDGRVLAHTHYTGVEYYTKHLCEELSKKSRMYCAKPTLHNKYLLHIWNHVFLPFMDGDLLFCPSNIAPLYVPKKKKLVVTLHDVAFLTYPDTFSSIFRNYYKKVIPKVLRRADKIITISETSKKEIIRYFPFVKDKLVVVYQGIDSCFRPLKLSKKRQILYVGSFNERKNFRAVIEAFERLKVNGYKLVLAGNFSSNFKISNLSQRAYERARNNPNIEFKTYLSRQDFVKLYNESMFLVFPSLYEGFGLPPLEAMACGTPVITSNLSSMPEICGDIPVYCNPYDIEGLTKKMELLIKDHKLRKKMGIEGLRHVSKFNWSNSAKEHMKVFEEVMNII